MLRKPGPNARGGFTLTEIAIVLGIIGILLGAIWTAASRTSDANKVQKASGQVLQILNNYRSMFAQRGVDVGTAANPWTDLTCQGVTNGFFPSEMIAGGCTAGTTTTYPVTPWGGSSYVAVYAFQGNGGGIIIQYSNLSQSACSNLAAAMTAAPDLMWEDVNAANQFLPPYSTATPWGLSTISGLCAANNGNYLQMMYSAK